MTADRLRELQREGRLEDAAALAEREARHLDAAELWERACDFARAARALLRAGDPERAFLLAARAGDRSCIDATVDQLVNVPDAARRAAGRAARAGAFVEAGRLFEALGEDAPAARAYDSAGDLVAAARAFERAGDVRSALVCLGKRIEATPRDDEARIRLGRLLVHARPQEAAETVQGVANDSPLRRDALALLFRAFTALGMPGPARLAEEELARLPGMPFSLEAPAAAAAKEVLFGRYELLCERGRGATSRLFEAFDRIAQRKVAVKLFSVHTLGVSGRDAQERFEREARVLSALAGAGAVPLLEYVPSGPAVVLEWMPGGSFEDVLMRGPVSPRRAVEIAIRILRVLSEAHRRGVLHRDVKPANVLFDAAGTACLGDFGTAHFADAASTVTAGVLGTLAYVAPEQRAGERATAASDVYGVGAILVRALTGALPEARAPFSSPELDAGHRAVVEALVAPLAARPTDTVQAIALLESVNWPERRPLAIENTPAPSEPPPSARFVPVAGDRFHDLVLGRDVVPVPLSERTLERARAFARADHPGLATVIAVDEAGGVVWVEAAGTESLSGPLDETDFHALEGALRALHAAGGAHGAVDRAHLFRRGAALALGFPTADTGTGRDADWHALGRLR